jgi:hypothetical protein
MRALDEKAVHAKEKKGALGPDIDLDSFQSEAVHHDYIAAKPSITPSAVCANYPWQTLWWGRAPGQLDNNE